MEWRRRMGIKIPGMAVERRGEMKPTFGSGWKGGKREGGMGREASREARKREREEGDRGWGSALHPCHGATRSSDTLNPLSKSIPPPGLEPGSLG
jgi:hypothetical protein